MAQIKNERDVVIGSSSTRVIPANSNYIQLVASSPYFKVSAAGEVTPSTITIEAKLFGVLDGTVTFTPTPGTAVVSATGNTATLAYEAMTADYTTITGSLEYLGSTYTAVVAVAKLRDGATGGTGDSIDIVYRRAASKPDTPAMSGAVPEGWYSTVDSLDTDVSMPVWASVGTKSVTYNGLYVWTEPYVIVGSSIIELTVFKRSLQALSTPGGGSYNFTNKTLTAPEGWSSTIPTGTAPIYTSKATAAIYGSIGTDSSIIWSTPELSIQNSVILVLDSANQLVTTDEYGKQYIYPTGNTLKLYSGGVLQAPPNVSFTGTASKNGLTLTVNSATGLITLDGINWITDKEDFVLSAEYAGVQYQTVYTITKTKAGSSAIVLDLLKETEVVFAASNGTGYFLPQDNKLTLYRGSVAIETDVAYSVEGSITGTLAKSGLTLNINSTTGAIALSGNTWDSNEESFTLKAVYEGVTYTTKYSIVKSLTGAQGIPGNAGAPGEPGVIFDIRSAQEVVPALNNGTGYTLPTGNIARLYYGSTLLSTGVSFAGNTTKNGLTFSINSSTGVITLSGDSWTTDRESFDITATYGTSVYTRSYTVAKLRQGSIGVDGAPTLLADLLSEADVVPTLPDGSGYTFPTGNQLRLYRGGTQVVAPDVSFKALDSRLGYVPGNTSNFSDTSSLNHNPIVHTNFIMLASTLGSNYKYSFDSGSNWANGTVPISGMELIASTRNAVYGSKPSYASTFYYAPIINTGLVWSTRTVSFDYYKGYLTGNGDNRMLVVSNPYPINSNYTIYFNTLKDTPAPGTVISDTGGGSVTTLCSAVPFGMWITPNKFSVLARGNNQVFGRTYQVGDTANSVTQLVSFTFTIDINNSCSGASNMTSSTGSTAIIVNGTTSILITNDSGLSWTTRTAPTALRRIIYSQADSCFIAIANNGNIYNSSGPIDSPTWTLVWIPGISPILGLNKLSDGKLLVSGGSSSGQYQTATSALISEKDGVLLYIDSNTGDITLSPGEFGWTTDYAAFEFEATYVPTNEKYNSQYSISKAKAGIAGQDITALYLSSGENLVIQTNSTGTTYTLPTGSTATLYRGGTPLTGVAYNINSSTQSTTNTDLVYKTQSGLSVFISKTTGAITFSGAAWTSNAETFTINATYNTTVYSRQLTLAKLKAGDTPVVATLISEADVIPANSLGGGYVFPTTANNLEVYLGPTKLTSGVVYGGTTTKNGLTLTINTLGAITLSGASWSTNAESFVVTATYNAIVYSKVYTITKSLAGSNAVLMDLDRESVAMVTNNDGTGYTLPGPSVASLYSGGAKLTTGVTYNISGGVSGAKTQNGLTATVNASTGAISLSGAAWNTTFEEFTITATYNGVTYTSAYKAYKVVKGAAGDSAIGLDLKSEADVIASDAYGGSYLYPTSNLATLYVGGLVKSTGVVFGIAGGTSGVKTQNGLTLTINTSTGAISYSGAAWTTTQEFFDITAVYGGNTYTSTYTITKAKAGTSVVNIDLLSEVDFVNALNNGTGYSLPAVNQIRLYLGAARVTTGVAYSGTTTKNGLTATVDATSGTITISGANNSWTTDSETFDVTATYAGTAYVARYRVTKNKQGAAGAVGNSARICYTRTILSNLATTPSTISTTGSTSYPPNDSWGTGTIWQATAPVISAGQSVWQSNGIYDPSTGATTWGVPYLSALKVGQLSAITADLGTITAGSISGASIKIGTNAAVSGSTMTGTGLVINTDGTFALGNPGTNLSFNGSRLTLNGDIVTAANIQQGAVQYINSTYRGDQFNFSSAISFTDVTQTILSLQVYCTGGPILIFAGVRSSGIVEPQYRRTSTGTTLWGRSRYFSVMRGYNNSTTQVGNDLSTSQTDSNFVIQAYDPTPGTGYNTYNLQVRLAGLPTDTNYLSPGFMLFRSIMIIQVK